MAFIQIVLKAIGKIWSFVSVAFLVAVLIAFIFFLLTVFMPDAILRAIDIIKTLLTEVGIVGFG